VTVVVLATLIIAAVVALHAVLIAPSQLRTTMVDVPLVGLPRAFDGYRIVVLSDLHHWEPGGRKHLRRIVATANAARPDLIALLGDYGVSFEYNRRMSVFAYRRALPALGEQLRELRAPDGLVAVLGNHDHYYDKNRVADWLRGLTARVLINDQMVIRRGGETLIVAGVDDALEGEVDPGGGVRDREAGSTVVVLSHNPDGVLSMNRGAGIGLVLSGHTHGGQVVIPGYGAPITVTRICGRRTASGWIPNDIAPLYVTTGAGSQYPIRFRCPPEVLVVQLRVPPGQQPA
jgi:predicted MPP superfamily phosphohydrolase